jgi:hypothetical protein
LFCRIIRQQCSDFFSLFRRLLSILLIISKKAGANPIKTCIIEIVIYRYIREKGRKGEREKGRKGEREKGRKGEREKGRKGSLYRESLGEIKYQHYLMT